MDLLQEMQNIKTSIKCVVGVLSEHQENIFKLEKQIEHENNQIAHNRITLGELEKRKIELAAEIGEMDVENE
jgi:predicted  nucleic acid-binding Zn-ribbon protein